VRDTNKNKVIKINENWENLKTESLENIENQKMKVSSFDPKTAKQKQPGHAYDRIALSIKRLPKWILVCSFAAGGKALQLS